MPDRIMHTEKKEEGAKPAGFTFRRIADRQLYQPALAPESEPRRVCFRMRLEFLGRSSK